jgi:hypothetical protein
VIEHYFLPLIDGSMTVEIVDANGVRRLDSATLAEATAQMDLGLLDLARWSLDTPSDHQLRLPEPERSPAPVWIDELIDDGSLAPLRERFDKGQPVAFDVPVWVKPVASDPVLASFQVFLMRDPDLASAQQHFVRDGITIAGVRTSLPKGMRCLVSIRDAPLVQFLGDSENPAHTEWQERSPKFKNKYRHGPFTLRYVRNAPRELVKRLTRPTQGRQPDLLKSVFSMAEATAEPAPKRAEPGGDDRGQIERLPSGDAIPSDAQFELTRRRGGFRLQLKTGAVAPEFLQITAAYDVRRGDAFRKFQALDFSLAAAPIRIRAVSGKVVEARDNRAVVQISSDKFKLTVTGFDPHRDVRVRILPLQQAVPL